MKKLLLFLLLLPINSFAISGECHRQSNPIGYTNYDVCEVVGTGYTCVSLEGKRGDNVGGISCFPTSIEREQEEFQEKEEQEKSSIKRRGKFSERAVGER